LGVRLLAQHFDDEVNADRFVSRHFVRSDTADGLELFTLSGVLILHQIGTDREWFRDEIHISLGVPGLARGELFDLRHWAPFVTISAIANDGAAMWAGWAVDWFRLTDPLTPARKFTIETGIAVRDSDGWLLRLGYKLWLAGVRRLEALTVDTRV
jgi:hypothetical protein